MKKQKFAVVIFVLLLAVIIMATLLIILLHQSNIMDNGNIQENNSFKEKVERVEATNSGNNKIILSDEEYDLLVHLVYAESGICSQECQRDVASVVINRLNSGKWGDTITEVIYYKNAFTPASSNKFLEQTPNKSCYDAVDYVLENGPTVPTEVRYFRTDYDFKWEDYENYKIIDNVYFGYFEDWKNGVW